MIDETLLCLKKCGQRLDLEIAAEMGVPLATVRKRLDPMLASNRGSMAYWIAGRGRHAILGISHYAGTVSRPDRGRLD